MTKNFDARHALADMIERALDTMSEEELNAIRRYTVEEREAIQAIFPPVCDQNVIACALDLPNVY